MTEKRFTLDYEDVDYIGIDEWENGENIKSYDIYNGKFKEVDLMSIVNRMNELSEENEQLKSSDTITDLECEIAKLKKENGQLKRVINKSVIERLLDGFEESYKDLEKENEQLKKQLRDKECEWLRNNTVWEQMPSSRKSVTKTSLRLKPTKKGGCGVSKQDLNIKVRDDGVYILETENYRFHLDEKTHVEKMGRLINENEQLKQRNDRQYNQLKQLWELIEKEDYNTLRSMLNQRETDEKLLQSEWRTYCD